MFTEGEMSCADNCVRKMFGSDRLIRAYMPLRMRQTGNLSMSELQKRLNNPTN